MGQWKGAVTGRALLAENFEMNVVLNRRQSLQTLGLATLALAMPRFGHATEADAKLTDWLDGLYRNAAKLKHREISGLQWQEVMDELYRDVPLLSLQKRLDFPTLQQQIIDQIGSERSELFHRVILPGSEVGTSESGEPQRVLITKVAYVKQGRSIPPHGHSNMTSAFLCMSGEFAVRQYDKIEEQENHMVLRQTMDENQAGAGTWSSISDYRDNVHWLTAKTDDCFLFTCKLIALEKGRKLNGRINVDVHRAEQLGSQTIRAPKITAAEAAQLY